MKSDVIEVSEVKFKDLKPWKDNPRDISEQMFERLRESISTFGYALPILVTKDNKIIGGHQRVKALKALGTTPDDIITVFKLKKKITVQIYQQLNVMLNIDIGEFDFAKLKDKKYDPEILLRTGIEKYQLGITDELPMGSNQLEKPDDNEGKAFQFGDDDGEDQSKPPGKKKAIPHTQLVQFTVKIPKSYRDKLFTKISQIQAEKGYTLRREALEFLIDEEFSNA